MNLSHCKDKTTPMMIHSTAEKDQAANDLFD